MIRQDATFAVIALLACLTLTVADLAATSGHVLFSQDDPYIHLALAQRLLQTGHYGINVGEAAAPASSILYPFLLVPLLWLGLGSAGALIVNMLAATLCAVLLSTLLRAAGYRLADLPPLLGATIACAWVIGFNLAGVALTGMEHEIQIALSLTVLLGLYRLYHDNELLWFLPFAAAVLPLVRYEGVGLWLVSVAALALRGRRRLAASVFGVTALGLASFSLVLVLHGLPALPSSVLSKAGSGMMGAAGVGGNAAAILLHNVRENFGSGSALPLAVLALANIAALGRRSLRRKPTSVMLACTGAFISLSHVLAGKFGGFGRYEAYAIVVGTMSLVVLTGPLGAPWLSRRSPAFVTGFALLPLITFAAASHYQAETPLAAQNIYSQHYQLHRFIVQYWRGSAAVNDLGEVSFNNPYYVLDYAGLGSEQARLARASSTSAAWMDALARQHDIGLVMIFPSWFPVVPAEWRAVAYLHLNIRDVVAGAPIVTFYATSQTSAARLAPLLPAFAAALPQSASLMIPHM